MTPQMRKQKIRELIKERLNMKISDLSFILGVSEMTIHRDLAPLVEEGYVMKTFGGITLVRKEPRVEKGDDCVLCNRTTNNRFTYRLILKDKIENTCCPHCGLIRQFQLGDEVIQSVCYDFFTGNTISASFSWYVFDSTLRVGCCKPQILTFESKEHAEGFVKGFEGNILDFNGAIESVYNLIKGFHCCTDKFQN